MAKIYSLTIDADNCGTETTLHYTEASRNLAALAAVKDEWRDDLGPMPENWWDAYEVLHGKTCYCDLYIYADDHEIDPAQLEA